jgi:acetylglutamate kinase
MKETVLLKIGGRAAEKESALLSLAGEIKKLTDNFDFILVHGGGAAVSAIQKVYGIEPLFVDGKRITAPQEMDIVDMGLSGKMNTYLVRLFYRAGLQGVGLSGCDGGLFTGKSFENYKGQENRSGSIESCDPALVLFLLEKGYTPVISSVSQDRSGRGININADEAALGLARSLKASKLLFISDIPGILENERLISHLNENEARKLISRGVISGGMIPKVESSLGALHGGVNRIVITDYENNGDLINMLKGDKGTSITL